MTDVPTNTNTEQKVVTEAQTSVAGTSAPKSTSFGGRGAGRGERPRRGRGGRPGEGGDSRRGGGRPRRTNTRARPEFDQKVIDVRRVARVVAGGRRFSFSVVIILGDRKGRVGVGIGKGGDTSLAIEKATRFAKKSMIKIPLTESMSIPHETGAKYSSAVVEIVPAPGKGLVAGSSVRTVLDFAGVTDVAAKVMARSKNKLNNARAAIEALKRL
ncbi:MAG: 30S ribosomal protein S5 [Parcubacteria group bacterium]|nr:30S ribosomal protein S5 [Parcubacteria group bacterium]